MNYKKACAILNIKKPIHNEKIKKAYRKLALRYHPDKSKDENSSIHFQEINEAYLFLQENDEHVPSVLTSLYDISSELCFKILSQLPDESLAQIYMYLKKQEKYLNHSILNYMLSILNEKKVIELNPTLDNLLNHEIYKLNVNDKTYMIPLWHDELIYSEKFKVLCIPQLPNHVTIDTYNNLIVHITIKNKKKKTYEFNLGKKKFHFILNDKVLFEKKIIFKHIGIPEIHSNIYNVENKMDIICMLSFDS